MNYWGGDISSNGPSLTTAQGTTNTLTDKNRSEPDDEWDNGWVVLNPGSVDQVNKPTIWRNISDTAGWVLGTGTLTINGSWPAPYTAGVPANVPYELFKVYRPENWMQAINFAISYSYPYRHRAFNFELPQNNTTRIVNYGRLAKQFASVTNPGTGPTVTEIADGTGGFDPGVYTVAYTYYNDFGETLISPTSTITIAGTNSRIKFAQVSSVPSGVLGINYYCSLEPGDASLDLLDINSAIITPGSFPTNLNFPTSNPFVQGTNLNGIVYPVEFTTPNPWFGVSPPSYNTTVVDFFRVHAIHQRINPGGHPEIWNELGGELWTPQGEGQIMLAYWPIPAYSLRFVCTATLPLLQSESDATNEPSELIYSAAEYYLWNLLVKTSTIVNVNWDKLAQASYVRYQQNLGMYKMDTPKEFKHRPAIQTFYR